MSDDLVSPPKWKQSTLGASCSLLRDGTHLPPKRVEEGPLLLSVQNMIRGRLQTTPNDTRVSWAFYQQMHRSWAVMPNDVLLAIVGATIGKVCRAPSGFPPYTLQRSVAVLRGDQSSLLSEYLFWVVSDQSFTEQIWQRANQTAQPGLYLAEIQKLRFLLPPLPQQRKIARILTTLDNVITQTEALIAKYQAIKQGLMHDLFTRGVDATGKIRSPQPEAPELYKQSELGWIPKEWECGTINEYCDIHNHLRFPIAAEERAEMQGEYPYYGPTGIFDSLDHYRVDGEYALIGEDGDHFLKFATHPMTILVSGKFNVNNHAHLLLGKNGCTTQWVFTFFCHRDIKPHLTHQGAGRLKLNKAALRAMPLVVPPTEEQSMICERFRSVNVRVQKEKEQVDKCRRLKTGLMQDLLTGKVPVKADEIKEIAAHA